MSELERTQGMPSDDALEQLLTHASPRPVPSQSDEAAVRQAVRAEWRNVASRHQTRRRALRFAVAATVLVGVFSVFSAFRTPVVEVVQVASIEKSFGAIYVMGKQAVLHKTDNLSNVHSGQTIETRSEAGIALAWGKGGSLRVDENTRVEFTTDASVYLKSGRIYFDSQPSSLIASASVSNTKDFVVHTDYGDVDHLGTQFMTEVAPEALIVSVREGRVSVAGAYQADPYVALSGRQVRLSGRQQPIDLDFSGSGKDWDWVGRTAPSADTDGKIIDDFLHWVARELGLELRYEGQAKRVALKESLAGDFDGEPREVLRQALLTTTLAHRIDEVEGVIYVSD